MPRPDLEARSASSRWPKPNRASAADGSTIAWGWVGPRNGRTPIVYANGWTCPDGYWVELLPDLVEAGHPAIVFDNRGHGASTLPRDPGAFAQHLDDDDVSVATMAADIVAVLDDASVDRAVLMGHSLGVQNILEVPRLHGHRLAGLVPLAGTYENPVSTFAGVGFLDPLAPIGWALFRALPLGLLGPAMRALSNEDLGHFVMRMIRAAGPGATKAHLAPHVEHIGHVHLGAMLRMMAQMHVHSAGDVLPSVDAPVLVCAGTKDVFTPYEVQARIAELVQDGELLTVEDGGHMLPVERPDLLVPAILDFLARRVG